MAITVQHSPDFRLLGGAAYSAGLGQYQERLRQQQFAEDQARARLALEAQGQQAKIAAANRAQQMDFMRMQTEAAIAQQRQADFLARDAQNRQLQQQEFQGLQNWRQAQLDDNAAQRQAVEQQALARQNSTWNQAGASNLEDEIADRVKALNTTELTADGKAIKGKLLGELRAIQKQRAMLASKPEAYNDLLTQWLARHDEANVTAFVAPQKSAEERLKSQTVPVYADDGSVLGAWVLGEGKGAARFQPIQPAAPKASASGKKSGENYVGVPFETFISDGDNFEKWRADAIKSLTPPGPADPDAPPISEEKIEEQMRKRYAAWQKMTKPPTPPEEAKPVSPTPAATRSAGPPSPQDVRDMRNRILQEKLDIAKVNRWVDPDTTPQEFANRFEREYDRRAAQMQMAPAATGQLAASQPPAVTPNSKHAAEFRSLVNAVGTSEALNIDRLVQDANSAEMVAMREGKGEGAGKQKYKEVQNAIIEYKKMRAMFRDVNDYKARATPAQRARVAELIKVFGPYMNAQ